MAVQLMATTPPTADDFWRSVEVMGAMKMASPMAVAPAGAYVRTPASTPSCAVTGKATSWKPAKGNDPPSRVPIASFQPFEANVVTSAVSAPIWTPAALR